MITSARKQIDRWEVIFQESGQDDLGGHAHPLPARDNVTVAMEAVIGAEAGIVKTVIVL